MQKRSKQSLYNSYFSREECPTAETCTILSSLHPLHWHTCLKNHLCVRRGKSCVLTEQEQWCFNPWHQQFNTWLINLHRITGERQIPNLHSPISSSCHCRSWGCVFLTRAAPYTSQQCEFLALLQWNTNTDTQRAVPFQSRLRGHLLQWLWYLQLTDHSKKEEGEH